MEVSSFDGKKVLWELVDDHVDEEVKEHDEIGIWGFDFNLVDKDKERMVREGLSKYPYLLILMKLCTGD